ncbi:MAG: TonB-dependent receptor [Planctomycetota bacterium]|nr:TonB-dependent receptor [Planctomycetota bacterium]
MQREAASRQALCWALLILGCCNGGVLGGEESTVKKTDPQEGSAREDAEQPVPADESVKVVIEADKEKNPLPSNAPEAERLVDPVPQTGVKREVYEYRNNRRVGDILKRLPGITMDGGTGEENKDIKLRGLDKEFTRLQFDGIQLPGGGEKREFQVNRLPSFLIGDVKVIRNPTAEYESDGLAGRVAIDSRPIPEKLVVEGQAGFGGYNGLHGDLYGGNVGFGLRPLSWFGIMGVIDYLHEHAVFKKLKNISNGNTEFEDEERINDSINAFLDAGFFYPDGEVHVKPMALYLMKPKPKKKLNRNGAGAPTALEIENEEFDQCTLGGSIHHKHQFSDQLRWETQGGYWSTVEAKDKDKPSFNFPGGVQTFRQFDDEKEDKEDRFWQINSHVDLNAGDAIKHRIKVGGSVRFRERYREKSVLRTNAAGVTTNVTTPKDTYFLEEDYFAGYAQDEITPLSWFSITPGVRLEQVALRSRDAVSPEDEEDFVDLNPSLHFLFRPRNDTSVHLAFSRGVNRPKFDELSPFEQEQGADDLVIGNPDLRPAISHNVDVGVDYATKHVFAGVNFFYKEMYDHIQQVDTGIDRDGRDVLQVVNAGDGWLGGVELEQRLNLGITGVKGLESLTIWSNQTLLDSELDDPNGLDKPFFQQPKHIFNLGLDFNYEPWGTILALSWTHTGARHEFAVDKTKTILRSSSLDLYFQQRIQERLFIFFEADNLTGEKSKIEKELNLNNGQFSYKSEGGGRKFYMGLKWKF